jgi:hypothetical protein
VVAPYIIKAKHKCRAQTSSSDSFYDDEEARFFKINATILAEY